MSSNADLATLLALLSDYGRPVLNQTALSATPGTTSAGRWFCEVSINSMGAEEARALSDADQEIYWRTGVHVGARCIGSDMDPTEAARKCLGYCQRMMESDRGRFLRPVNKDEAMRREAARKEGRP